MIANREACNTVAQMMTEGILAPAVVRVLTNPEALHRWCVKQGNGYEVWSTARLQELLKQKTHQCQKTPASHSP